MRLDFSSNIFHRILMKGNMPAPKNELASSFSMPPHLHYKVHNLRHKLLYLQTVHIQTWNRYRGKHFGWNNGFQPMNQWIENKFGLRQLCPKFLFQYLLKNLSPFFTVCTPQVSSLPSPATHSGHNRSPGKGRTSMKYHMQSQRSARNRQPLFREKSLFLLEKRYFTCSHF